MSVWTEGLSELPPEAWHVRLVCTGRGSHKRIVLGAYDHEPADGPRYLDYAHVTGGHLRSAFKLTKGWQDSDPRLMRVSLPRSDYAIEVPGEVGWRSATFMSVSFLCRRCPKPDGSQRVPADRARETRVDAWRLIDVYVRAAAEQGEPTVDVSRFPEWT